MAIKFARTGQTHYLSPEVRNASRIGHPNVCRLFEIHTTRTADGEVDFITMEFLDGITLAERLRPGKLPEPEAREIALQLCAGLAEAHRNGVIHGDFKSQNIILTTDAEGHLRAVITDFGLAREATSTETTGGTPGYMAPELWAGGKPSIASDIYALGVVLYELIAGCRPHQAVAMAATTAPLGENFIPPPRYAQAEWQWSGSQLLPAHRRWDPIVARCLRQDPAKRFQRASDIAAVLDTTRGRRRVVLTIGAVALTGLTGFLTYKKATAPSETVQLAYVQTSPDPAFQRNVAARLGVIGDGPRTAFSVVTDRRIDSATHLLRCSITGAEDQRTVQVNVIDKRSQVNLLEWTGTYARKRMEICAGSGRWSRDSGIALASS